MMNSHSLPFGIETSKVNSILPHMRTTSVHTHHTHTSFVLGVSFLKTYDHAIICKIENPYSTSKSCPSTIFGEDFLLCYLNLGPVDYLPVNVSVRRDWGFVPTWSPAVQLTWCIMLLFFLMGFSVGLLYLICSKISMIQII